MSAITTGRIGEYFAAAVLEQRQWRTILCQQAGFDLIATRGEKIWRCQVKASTFHTYKAEKLQFHFGMGGDKRAPTIADYDFAACVSIPQRKVFFMPLEDISVRVFSRTGKFFEEPDIETKSLEHTMEILDARLTEPAPMHKSRNW
jgi:hypothetical protein